MRHGRQSISEVGKGGRTGSIQIVGRRGVSHQEHHSTSRAETPKTMQNASVDIPSIIQELDSEILRLQRARDLLVGELVRSEFQPNRFLHIFLSRISLQSEPSTPASPVRTVISCTAESPPTLVVLAGPSSAEGSGPDRLCATLRKDR
jgi:hypothetical protein